MTTIQFRRGTSAEWADMNSVLASGEPGFETDTGKHKIGDGESTWVDLVYFIQEPDLDEAFMDRVGEATVVPLGVSTAFVANGTGNIVEHISARGADPKNSHAEGFRNRAHNWHAHVEGSTCIGDGKISHTEGNACICTANDSHAEGNRTVAGRRYYVLASYGSEDAGDGLGILEYVVIPDSEGDVSSFFPNALISDVTRRYGVGAQADVKGNIYARGFRPAVWSDDTPTTPNDLQWAMHSICILRGGPSETAIDFAPIAKTVYTPGAGTKVFYRGRYPGNTPIGIYSSYSPAVLSGGNGQHAEGFFTSTWNYGAHAEGVRSRAWGYAAHSEGRDTQALGYYSHAEGYQTQASGVASQASGQQAVARRDYQQAYSSAMRAVPGDNQVTRIQYNRSCTGVGWHPIPILKDLVAGSYHFEQMVLGRQTAGPAGTVGDAFAYKFSGLVTVVSGAMRVDGGLISRTLVGRTNGMTGDGLTTGPRMSEHTSLYSTGNVLITKFDGLADATFYVSAYSTIQELLG